MASFIEFPIFTGVSGDLRPWISWLEAFFVREKFKKLEKMNLAQSLLEGEAESWFYSIQTTLIFCDWRELKDKLLLRFGDVADSDRIRLIADFDRFLLKQRADAKLRSLSRTAITPQESISSPATIHETVPVAKFPNQHVDEISGEKKDESHEATMVTVLDSLEEESITQNQVPVSKLEHSLPIPKKSLNVCETSQAVVSCEHQRSIQKTIGLDVVNSDVERIQCVDVVGCDELGKVENVFSGLSPTSQVWEPGGVLADHVLEDNVEAGSKGLAYDGCVISGMNGAGCGRGTAGLLATGQQMQRTDLFSELLKDLSNGGAESFPFLTVATEHSFLWLQKTSENYLIVSEFENKKQMLGYKTRMFKYKSSFRITRSASRDMNQFVGFMKFQLKHKWRSKHLHTISALGFYLSSVFSTVPSATSGRLQGLLEQVLQKDDEAYPQILDKLQLNLKQGMDVHRASGLRLFLCQQKFSSIWHRWRRKDSDLEVQLKERALVQSSVSPELLDEAVWIPEVGCRELLVKWQDHDASENFWMFSKDFVQLYPSSKLEDKLVFEGGSIDTIKQSYYRKKKPWVETEGFSCKEALEGNGGFAVSLEV